MANGRIRCEKSPEIASTWLKLTLENGARAFSHSLGQERTEAAETQDSAKQTRTCSVLESNATAPEINRLLSESIQDGRATVAAGRPTLVGYGALAPVLVAGKRSLPPRSTLAPRSTRSTAGTTALQL